MKNVILFLLLSGFVTCDHPTIATAFEDAPGNIKVFICSRGCYQYLLEHDGTYYFPDELPASLKVDGKEVIFSGDLQSDSTMVKKPAPNDAPVDDFKARNIKIISVKAR
jgi:hypothetical protein